MTLGGIRVSFRVTILVLFAALTFGLSATILYISYVRNTQTALSTAHELLEQVAIKSKSDTEALVAPLYSIADLLTLLPADQLDAGSGDENRPMARLVRSSLERFPQIASMYVGNSKGEFFRIASLEGDRSLARSFMQAPNDSMFAVQSIMSTASGERLMSWRFFSADNRELLARSEPDFDYDPRQRPWYQLASTSDRAAVTDYYVFSAVPSVGLTVARKFGDPKQTVFGADITLSAASKRLSSIRTEQLGNLARAEIAMFKLDGRMIAHSDAIAFERYLDGQNQPRLPNVGELGSSILRTVMERERSAFERETNVVDAHGAEWLAHVLPLASPFGEGAHIAVVVPLDEFLGPLAASARNTLIISALIVLAFLPIVYYLASTISRPLAYLTTQVANLRKLDQIEREAAVAPHSIITEVQNLADALSTSRFMLRAFGKFVPKSLVQGMIDSGVEPAIAGERKSVAVLFTDVRDFTTMSEELAPEQLMAYTSDYLEGLVEIVLRHNGTVDKFVGDQIMAFWNAPTPNPNYIIDSCIAVLRCRD